MSIRASRKESELELPVNERDPFAREDGPGKGSKIGSPENIKSRYSINEKKYI